jgi:hypothetical protein
MAFCAAPGGLMLEEDAGREGDRAEAVPETPGADAGFGSLGEDGP